MTVALYLFDKIQDHFVQFWHSTHHMSNTNVSRICLLFPSHHLKHTESPHRWGKSYHGQQSILRSVNEIVCCFFFHLTLTVSNQFLKIFHMWFLERFYHCIISLQMCDGLPGVIFLVVSFPTNFTKSSPCFNESVGKWHLLDLWSSFCTDLFGQPYEQPTQNRRKTPIFLHSPRLPQTPLLPRDVPVVAPVPTGGVFTGIHSLTLSTVFPFLRDLFDTESPFELRDLHIPGDNWRQFCVSLKNFTPNLRTYVQDQSFLTPKDGET